MMITVGMTGLIMQLVPSSSSPELPSATSDGKSRNQNYRQRLHAHHRHCCCCCCCCCHFFVVVADSVVVVAAIVTIVIIHINSIVITKGKQVLGCHIYVILLLELPCSFVLKGVTHTA